MLCFTKAFLIPLFSSLNYLYFQQSFQSINFQLPHLFSTFLLFSHEPFALSLCLTLSKLWHDKISWHTWYFDTFIFIPVYNSHCKVPILWTEELVKVPLYESLGCACWQKAKAVHAGALVFMYIHKFCRITRMCFSLYYSPRYIC